MNRIEELDKDQLDDIIISIVDKNNADNLGIIERNNITSLSFFNEYLKDESFKHFFFIRLKNLIISDKFDNPLKLGNYLISQKKLLKEFFEQYKLNGNSNKNFKNQKLNSVFIEYFKSSKEAYRSYRSNLSIKQKYLLDYEHIFHNRETTNYLLKEDKNIFDQSFIYETITNNSYFDYTTKFKTHLNLIKDNINLSDLRKICDFYRDIIYKYSKRNEHEELVSIAFETAPNFLTFTVTKNSKPNTSLLQDKLANKESISLTKQELTKVIDNSIKFVNEDTDHIHLLAGNVNFIYEINQKNYSKENIKYFDELYKNLKMIRNLSDNELLELYSSTKDRKNLDILINFKGLGNFEVYKNDFHEENDLPNIKNKLVFNNLFLEQLEKIKRKIDYYTEKGPYETEIAYFDPYMNPLILKYKKSSLITRGRTQFNINKETQKEIYDELFNIYTTNPKELFQVVLYEDNSGSSKKYHIKEIIRNF